jgi:hypothetical protein
MITLRLVLPATILCAIIGGTLPAEPAAKGGSIRKEPPYQTKDPRYCHLVFGPGARQSVWLVIDGDDLYVDRNGSGDLTEKGSRCFRMPAFLGGGFVVPELAIGERKTTYTNLTVYWTPQPPGKAKKDFPVDVLVDVNKQYCQAAMFEASGTSPKDAPILHFGGPLQMALHAEKATLPAPGGTQQIGALIGTTSSTGHFAMVRNDRNLAPNAGIDPLAQVTFPGKPGAEPVTITLKLNKRCCNARFYSTLRTPAEVGPGKAQVVLSFPAWTDISVSPATRELAVGGGSAPNN